MRCLAAWNGTIDLDAATIKPPGAPYEITNLQLCFIDLIAAGSLPAPAEKAQWPAGEAIAYLVKDVPLPWKAWQGAGASDGEIEQAGIVLGEAIGADQVRAWGRPSPEKPMEPLPGSDLRIPGFRWRVDIGGHLGTSPPGRLAVFEGRRWYGIEVDPATVRQTFKRNGAPKDIRPSKEEWAKVYTANYIAAERKAEREPTLTGLRQAALKDKKSGVRTQLDDAFRQQYEVKRGRRKKSAE